MPTTTTTTPIPTEFKCYENEIPSITPLIHPWPCCGRVKRPEAIYGKVTYQNMNARAGTNPCGFEDSTVNPIWTIPKGGECPRSRITLYYSNDVTFGLAYNSPCWTAYEFYPTSGLIGIYTNMGAVQTIRGGCEYVGGAWKFTAGGVYRFEYPNMAPGYCLATIQINGVI
jgi:hypothetical protein